MEVGGQASGRNGHRRGRSLRLKRRSAFLGIKLVMIACQILLERMMFGSEAFNQASIERTSWICWDGFMVWAEFFQSPVNHGPQGARNVDRSIDMICCLAVVKELLVNSEFKNLLRIPEVGGNAAPSP